MPTLLTVRRCLTVNCCATANTDYVDIPSVAFVAWSNGPNTQNQMLGNTYPGGIATPGQGITTGMTVRVAPSATPDIPTGTNLNYDDIVKWITFEELKNKAGCYGSTQGRLRILNNELPKFTTGSGYNATVYAEGGVPFAGGQYRWCIQGTLPVGITATSSTTCPGWSATANVRLSAISVTDTLPANVTFMVQDNDTNPNTAQRTLLINP